MNLSAVLILAACCLLLTEAAPEKSLNRLGQKSRLTQAQAKNQDQVVDVKQQQSLVQAEEPDVKGQLTKDPSSGRLFLKKFLTFKNLFSSSNQPVIPIIITGAGTSTATTGSASPTVTVTSTGTIPSATGTITTSPTSPTTTSPTARQQPMAYGANEQADQQDQEQDEEQEQLQPAAAYPADLMDEQALQAALAAGAQEYEVVTDEPVQGTAQGSGAGESKATQANSHINLRRKGSRRGQVISVRIPPRYRRYFKNGQKVMLNTGSRPVNKRRVVRKRVPSKKLNNRRRGGNKKNRKNRNKNRRTRIIPA
ncbi:hypothetical protein KR018_011680 [Drosophila ironensis]|nr:hypothetical protein KR018_011680 [Drosophila ironensis]